MTRLDNDLISRKALLEEVKQLRKIANVPQSIQDEYKDMPEVFLKNKLTAFEVINFVTNAPTIEADSGEAVAYLWESIGRWSAYLASNGSEANLAPPDWLLDAVKKATSPQKQWVSLCDSEWVNIVNHDRGYESMNKDEAVHLAVKLTEAKLKEVNHELV